MQQLFRLQRQITNYIRQAKRYLNLINRFQRTGRGSGNHRRRPNNNQNKKHQPNTNQKKHSNPKAHLQEANHSEPPSTVKEETVVTEEGAVVIGQEPQSKA